MGRPRVYTVEQLRERRKAYCSRHYLENRDRLGYNRFPRRVGVYSIWSHDLVERGDDSSCYIGCSKNIHGRFQTHRVTTIPRFLSSIADPESWTYSVVLDLTDCPLELSCSQLGAFEWLFIMVSQKLGQRVYNKYNCSYDETKHGMVQMLFPIIPEEAQARVRHWMEILGLDL